MYPSPRPLMLPENSAAIRVALKKTRGMVEKIDTMLDEDRYCIDIAQQVNAAIGLLRGINRTILVHHLHTCGRDKLASPDKKTRQEFIDEVLHVTEVTGRKL